MNNNTKRTEKLRLMAIAIVGLLVIATGTLYSYTAFKNGDIAGGLLGAIIAIIILVFAILVYKRGNTDLKNGFPIKDERSQRVLEKASSRAFYVSLYLLLAVGFVSDSLINFRDVSQATGLTVGGMALLFAAFWAYYSRKEI